MVLTNNFKVDSPNVKYENDHIVSNFTYHSTVVEKPADPKGDYKVTPVNVEYTFKTDTRVPKLGVMLVGLAGNNGSTVVGGCIANREGIAWRTKNGPQKPNYYGSITQSSTVCLGTDRETGQDIFTPLKSVVPMADPNDIVWGGWDINNANLAEAMERAKVFDYDLQRQLVPYMKDIKPMPSIYDPDFIASNQQGRANNLIKGSKYEQMEQIRKDIRDFKEKNKLDKVIVLWTANTERFSDIRTGLNDTADNLLNSLKKGETEISPSTIFAIASILEKVPYINGSPSNTFVPGVMELAEKEGVPIGGDDFKSGQTKMKSVLVDFLINAGLKVSSIVSYNHLGNNDGKNLSEQKQFRSKEITKSNVVDDMVSSNEILYKPNESPDHCVVIKYIPYVQDSKRAMDEYTSEIFMGGQNTIVMHNTCEDSLLATPIILDLIILAEVSQRISYKTSEIKEFQSFHPVMSILSFLLKAPLVPPETPVVNALFKQRANIDNILKACVGLPPDNNMRLEYNTTFPARTALNNSK